MKKAFTNRPQKNLGGSGRGSGGGVGGGGGGGGGYRDMLQLTFRIG